MGSIFHVKNSFFTNPSKVALNAGGMNVKGNVFFRQDFQVEGELQPLGWHKSE